MNKVQNLILSGLTLVMSGIVMLISDSIGIGLAKFLVPFLFITSGVFAILFAKANLETKIPFQYNVFQGTVLILFGLIIGIATKSLDIFLSCSTYFIMFIGLFDIFYGFALLNSGFNWTWKKLLFKTIAGFLGLLGSVAILATSITDQYSGLMITGIVTILMGIETIVFATKIKTATI